MRAHVVLLGLVLGAAACSIEIGGGLLGRGAPLREEVIEGEGRDKVLLLDVTGVITDGPVRRAFGLVEEESTLARVEAALRKAGDDPRVKAVVLHVDSPGGGATASDQIYTELVRFKRERRVPLVAALGDLATSGGYYVACAADRIVAHPTTVTGSIGVILVSIDASGLLAKVGVRNETIKAGEHKDMLSPLRAPTPEEREIAQRVLDGLRARFVAVVRESRPGLDASRLPQLTDGRILDAGDALSGGLVDEMGDLHRAIVVAREAAGLTRARVVRYDHPGESRETLFARGAGAPAQVNLLPLDLGTAVPGPRFLYLWSPP